MFYLNISFKYVFIQVKALTTTQKWISPALSVCHSKPFQLQYQNVLGLRGRCGEREFICQSSASPALPPPSSPLFPAHTQEVLCCGSLRSVLCFLATAACCFSLSSVCACEHVMSHAQESEKILFRHAHSEKPWKLNEGVSVNKTTFFLV